MDLHLRLLCMFAGLVVLVTIGQLLIRRKMDENHSLLWLPLGAVALIAGFFPDLIASIARGLGIPSPETMVLVVIILLLIIIVFKNTTDISVFRAQVHELAMNISMLNSEVRHLIEISRVLSGSEPGDMVRMREMIREYERKTKAQQREPESGSVAEP